MMPIRWRRHRWRGCRYCLSGGSSVWICPATCVLLKPEDLRRCDPTRSRTTSLRLSQLVGSTTAGKPSMWMVSLICGARRLIPKGWIIADLDCGEGPVASRVPVVAPRASTCLIEGLTSETSAESLAPSRGPP